MRNPVRSETDAFYIAVGSAVLIGAALVLGWLVDPLVAFALLAGAVVGAFVWEVSTTDPDRRRPLREAASEGRRGAPPTGPRVLVVANRTLNADALRDELRRRAFAGAELHIVAPIVTSRAHYIASASTRSLTRRGPVSRRRSPGPSWSRSP